MINLLKNVKAHLASFPNLGYIETFCIKKYTRKAFPKFKNRCVVISLSSWGKKNIGNRIKQETIEIDIVVVCRNFDNEFPEYGDDSISVIGDAPGGEGIIKMVVDMIDALLEFAKNNASTLSIMHNELENVDFDHDKFKEREEYFHEVILPLKVRFEPKEF
ncbi:MAG: hypothetical protein GY765_05400 [bacterium]|nr:hypothetical protein [bacterium]